MDVVYTAHARDRMRRRGVTEQDVETVLNNPLRQEPSHSGGIKTSGMIRGRRLFVVWHKGASGPERIIRTLFWEEQAT